MHRIFVVAASAVLAASPASAQQAAPSAAVEHDVRCFILYAGAAGSTSGDEQTPGLLGTAYFAGKVKAEAPALDLLAASRGAIQSLQGNPNAKAIGEDCDSEIHQFSSEMTKLGAELQKDGSQLPDSS